MRLSSSLSTCSSLLLFVCTGMTKATTANDQIEDSDAVSTFAPRDHTIKSSSVLLEQANLNSHPVINDANFKTLVRHCLKSFDETACDGMAQWDVSRVTDCSLLFWEPTNDANEDWVLLKGADIFNVDISAWNTSSCTTMAGMFNGAVSFDQPIGNWNVHKVTDMSHMFQGARVFNRDISSWKTDNVLSMESTFRYASRFHNPDLSRWDTSRVTNMAHMFDSAQHFNGKINWNVARVQHFQSMFHNADLFNSFIGDWNVGGAIDDSAYGFVSMFEGARDFNQDISHWDMRHALKLDYMFRDAYSFDQDLSPWSIEEVPSLQSMFYRAKSFKQTLCWDLSGKTIGKIFDGTQGGSADSNVAHCWDTKHYMKGNNQFGTSSSNGSIEAAPTTHKSPSMGWKFLQAFIMAAVVALASYWAILVRRYLRNQNDKQLLVQKVERRASQQQANKIESSSRGTCDDEVDEDNDEDDDDESDDEEILFETMQDQEQPRQNCFEQNLFLPSPSLVMTKFDEDPVEHAVPVMSTLLKQQAARHRKYVPGSSVRGSCRTLTQLSVDEQDRDMEDGQQQIVVDSAITEETSSNCWEVQPSTTEPKQSVVRSPLAIFLSNGGRTSTTKSTAVMSSEAPMYVIQDGNSFYQDEALDSNTAVSPNHSSVSSLSSGSHLV